MQSVFSFSKGYITCLLNSGKWTYTEAKYIYTHAQKQACRAVRKPLPECVFVNTQEWEGLFVCQASCAASGEMKDVCLVKMSQTFFESQVNLTIHCIHLKRFYNLQTVYKLPK